MKNIFLACLLPLALLTACSDGVPQVDDPYKIVVNGEPMTGTEFMKKYCSDKPAHETCMKVSRATIASSTRGKMPAGW
jgi:hypothetical protein